MCRRDDYRCTNTLLYRHLHEPRLYLQKKIAAHFGCAQDLQRLQLRYKNLPELLRSYFYSQDRRRRRLSRFCRNPNDTQHHRHQPLQLKPQ
jgi:hypothetical protein